MAKPWIESKAPIGANPADVEKAGTINSLLVRPIAILPSTLGDPIKPFAIGLWNDIRPLLRADLPISALRRATSAYTHSKRYLLSCAQPDAHRYDLGGLPVEPVSEKDRLAAQLAFLRLKSSPGEHQTSLGQPAPQTLTQPKSQQIRDGIFGRVRQSTGEIS